MLKFWKHRNKKICVYLNFKRSSDLLANNKLLFTSYRPPSQKNRPWPYLPNIDCKPFADGLPTTASQRIACRSGSLILSCCPLTRQLSTIEWFGRRKQETQRRRRWFCKGRKFLRGGNVFYIFFCFQFPLSFKLPRVPACYELKCLAFDPYGGCWVLKGES